MYIYPVIFSIILFLSMFTVWRFRYYYARTQLGIKYTFRWKSAYYLGVGAMLILALPELSLLFLLFFPLFLLRRHLHVVRAIRDSKGQTNSESYQHHLNEYLDSRSKRLVWLQINGRVLFVLLVLTEFSLALVGFVPGRIAYDQHFSVVDELIEFDGYAADERGIMHLNQAATNYARDYINKNDLGNELMFKAGLNRDRKHYTPYRVGWDFLEMTQGKVENEFSIFIDQLKSTTEISVDEKAILAYSKSPINLDGFRSIEFENIPSSKPKVFLLGDSFTWGTGVENISSSFADNLNSRGFLVYNSGIVGTNLPQYEEVARKYIERVKSDVVVNLFLGNDIAEHQIDLRPNQPQYFNTNAGTLMTAPHGKYVKTAQEAYERTLDQAMIPKDLSWTNRVAGQTRISTLVWRMFSKMGMIGRVASESSVEYWNYVNESKVGYSVNSEILKRIEQICKKNGCVLIVSIIPERDNINIAKSKLDEMLVNFPYVRISNLTKEDYSPDYHFNESGSRKYAEFLQTQIQKVVHKDR